jgi:hypothetical protein
VDISCRKLDGVVSDFRVLHPTSWVGIFRCEFIPLSSSVHCSAIGFLWFRLGDPSVLGSAICSNRLLISIVFQGFWLGCSDWRYPLGVSHSVIFAQEWNRIRLMKYDSSLPGDKEFQDWGKGANISVKDGVLRGQHPPPHGTTFCIWLQCNVNFLSSGLPQMQKIWYHTRQDWFRRTLTIRLRDTQKNYMKAYFSIVQLFSILFWVT